MKSFLIIIILLVSAFSAFAQTKKKPTKKPSKTPTVVQKPVVPPKANQRPETETPILETKDEKTEKSNSRPSKIKPQEEIYPYFYEFKQPQFIIGDVSIEHNESGKGKITFKKLDWQESISDPIQLSEATLEKLKNSFQTLNFLDSTEEYQAERHYAHLGVMKIRVKKDGKQREVMLDWTNNKEAKILLDEYRKLVDQFIWIFDMNVARENQPLEAPKLMEGIESLVQRNGIADAIQMIPYFKILGNDERIPLIARNKAKKLVEKLEKLEKVKK